MRHTLTLSICQFPISFLNWEQNCKQALNYIEAAKTEHAKLILFPEMTLSGIAGKVALMADTENKNLAFFQQAASKHSIAIGFGWGKPYKSKLENHYTVIDKNGTILSDYIKLHPFTYGGEDRCFVRGNDYQIFKYQGFQICTFICYDMRFPEIFQAASKDAQLIIVAANWPKARNLHWKVLAQARAIENQVYFAACNCVGNINHLEYSGDSALYSPEGKNLGSLSGKSGLITRTIINDVTDIRNGFPVKQDRRTAYYKTIL